MQAIYYGMGIFILSPTSTLEYLRLSLWHFRTSALRLPSSPSDVRIPQLNNK